MNLRSIDLKYSIIANMLQIFLSFVAYLFRKLGIYANVYIQVVLLIINIEVWFAVSTSSVIAKNENNVEGGVIFGIIATSPILFLIFAALLLDRYAQSVSGWSLYSILGAAINFWHRPLILLSRISSGNGYIIYLINVTLLIFVSILSYSYGSRLNNPIE
ncbi:MAG: hypothetical protein FWG10_05275 [Eubacteriaceae bacterium]|nr:hypothetical protein [Eubacteriaceae bacterium]